MSFHIQSKDLSGYLSAPVNSTLGLNGNINQQDAKLAMSDNRENKIETFFASQNSSLAKGRKYLWIGFIIGLVPIVYVQKEISGFVFYGIGFFFIFTLLVDFSLRKQLKLGQPLVTLTDDAIEALNLQGSMKRLIWSDIEKISLDVVQGTRLLSFQLKSSSGIANKKSFWTGANASKPTLTLSPFSPEDQEQLLDAINQRHAESMGQNSLVQNTISSELKEEREFHKRMEELQPNTWATYSLVAINVLIWFLLLTKGAGFASTPAEKLFMWGGNAASEVQKGEWWRLLSATFLHSGLMHVFMNMIGLYTAGIIVERIYGSRLFLIIYLGSGLMGSALSLHFSAQQSVSVGASGAVFGVTGALLVAVFQHRDKLPRTFSKQTINGIGFFILYSLMQGLSRHGIDNAAHIGGLLGGCIAALILPKHFDIVHFKKTYLTRAVAAIGVLTMATVSLAAIAPIAKVDQRQIIVSKEIITKAFKSFDAGIKSLQQEQQDIKSGKISDLEADIRSREIHAPIFRDVANMLNRVTFLPSDPRQPFVKNVKRASELLAESLAMESVFNDTTRKYEPVNPTRANQIAVELAKVNDSLVASTKILKK